MISLLAASLVLGAVALLRLSWRRTSVLSRLSLVGGWLLLLPPLYLLAAEIGIEYSLVYLCVGWSLFGALFVLFNSERTPRKPAAKPSSSKASKQSASATMLRRAALFFNTSLLAGLTACLLSLLVIQPLPLVMANRWLVGVLLFPLLWAVLAVVICASMRQLRLTILMALLSGGAFSFLYM
ncbi:hypothetical protein EDC56_2873 [Sinobacterium caligoides]|uniref:Uncharacterized protein n=1 Tax=Sinobacterium caligoides TaxID=933926 RepID=A0A3N2DLK2_9GAMM|nr:hypothetical protein [Sinobacterium caligoides]ROS00235.1 hypothetical protein EDC56_2873 [Sinobacterium caligoides]